MWGITGLPGILETLISANMCLRIQNKRDRAFPSLAPSCSPTCEASALGDNGAGVGVGSLFFQTKPSRVNGA